MVPGSRRIHKLTSSGAVAVVLGGVCLAIVVAAMVGGTAKGTAATGRADTAAGPAPKKGLTKGVGIFLLGEPYGKATGHDRYAYVVVDRGHAHGAAALPGTTLVYMSAVDNARFNTGVSRAQALAAGWLVRDANGQFVESRGYPGVYLNDVGNPAFQQAWLANVLQFLQSTHVDGVYIDNILSDIRPWTKEHVPLTTYADPAVWRAAMLSFLQAVTPALRARGYYVLVNAVGYTRGDPRYDDGSLTVDWWRQVGPLVSGLLTEYWMQNPETLSQLRAAGPAWYQEWQGWQRLVSVAQSTGADFFGFTYGSPNDVRTMRFARGSFLLD